MSETNSIVSLSTLASCMGLIVIGPMFRSCRIDQFREQIFALREELFFYALDERLLDQVAYRDFRHLLNSLVRYAHKITFLHVLVLMFMTRAFDMCERDNPRSIDALQGEVERLPDHHERRFNSFNERAVSLVNRHVIFGSVLFWPFVLGMVLILVVRGQVRASASLIDLAVRKLIPVSLLEAEALRASPNAITD